jgi:hypothetical protein
MKDDIGMKSTLINECILSGRRSLSGASRPQVQSLSRSRQIKQPCGDAHGDGA